MEMDNGSKAIPVRISGKPRMLFVDEKYGIIVEIPKDYYPDGAIKSITATARALADGLTEDDKVRAEYYVYYVETASIEKRWEAAMKIITSKPDFFESGSLLRDQIDGMTEVRRWLAKKREIILRDHEGLFEEAEKPGALEAPKPGADPSGASTSAAAGAPEEEKAADVPKDP